MLLATLTGDQPRRLRARASRRRARRPTVARALGLATPEVGDGRARRAAARRRQAGDAGRGAAQAGAADARGAAADSLHPAIGSELIAHVPYLVAAAAVVRDAHERLDGRGYPGGTRGDEVCLGARIVAVADAYDTMTRAAGLPRRHHSGAALAELQRCSGTQFDPRVVAAFEVDARDSVTLRPRLRELTSRLRLSGTIAPFEPRPPSTGVDVRLRARRRG